MDELPGAYAMHSEEATIVARLKAGNEDAYAWLINQYHQMIFALVYRLLDDPSDAPDTTQEVFIKVFRGMASFHGESSLKTWIYRIAIHEASNRRRWFFRHKAQELPLEPGDQASDEHTPSLLDTLTDHGESPFDSVARDQLRVRLQQVLQLLPEPYRAAVVLRDIEGLSYEEIADVTETSLGTVKSRLGRGREALRRGVERHARELLPATAKSRKATTSHGEIEVAS